MNLYKVLLWYAQVWISFYVSCYRFLEILESVICCLFSVLENITYYFFKYFLCSILQLLLLRCHTLSVYSQSLFPFPPYFLYLHISGFLHCLVSSKFSSRLLILFFFPFGLFFNFFKLNKFYYVYSRTMIMITWFYKMSIPKSQHIPPPLLILSLCLI